MKMGMTGCPKMFVRNYHYSLPNNPDEQSSQLLRGKSLKSRTTVVIQSVMSQLSQSRDRIWAG